MNFSKVWAFYGAIRILKLKGKVMKLHQIIRAVVKFEKPTYKLELSLSDIKELQETIESFESYRDEFLLEFESTNYQYLVIPKDNLNNIWNEKLEDEVRELFTDSFPEHMVKFFDREAYFKQEKELGRANYFGVVCNHMEIETEDFYLYLLKRNYKRS